MVQKTSEEKASWSALTEKTLTLGGRKGRRESLRTRYVQGEVSKLRGRGRSQIKVTSPRQSKRYSREKVKRESVPKWANREDARPKMHIGREGGPKAKTADREELPNSGKRGEKRA